MLRVRFAFVFVFVSVCGFSAFAVTCDPGYYLKANATQCTKCPTTGNKYCPGGTYTTASYDKGVNKCLSNGRPNGDYSACIVSFDKIDMKYGPKGKSTALKNQCWTKNTTREYAKCLFPAKAFIETSVNDVQNTVVQPTAPAER